MAAEWLKIKNDYISGSISYRKLAAKYDVNKDTIAARAKAENWVSEKKEQTYKTHTKAIQKTAEVVATKEADRISRILSAADLLLARVEEAAGQLDTHIVTNKLKTKQVTYNSKSKATKEVTTEEEIKAVVPGPVDRLGLQQVAAALKSLKDTVQAVEGGGGQADNNLFETIQDSTGEDVDLSDLSEIQQAPAPRPDVVEPAGAETP